MKLPSEAAQQEGTKSTHVADAPQVREATDRFGENPRKRQKSLSGDLRLGVDVSKLTEAGYHPHWINDQDGRVEAELAKGYSFVTYDEIGQTQRIGAKTASLDDKVCRVVGERKEGGPLYAYLLKIPERWWRENQEADQERPNAIDRQIRQGAVSRADGDRSSRGSFYDAGTVYEPNRSR